MKVLQWVEISIYILATIIHIVALTMLVRMSKHAMKGSQKFLFMSLSMTELSYCLLSFIRFFCIELGVKKSIYQHVSIFQRIAILLIYYFIMIYITLERFAAIYLNLKYGVYWSLRKTKRLIFFTSLFCIVAFISVSATWHKDQRNVDTFAYVYLYPAFMVVFIICAVITYSYIAMKIVKRGDTITKEVRGEKNEKRIPRLQRKTILIPTLIILTFIVFMVVPNFMLMVHYVGISKLSTTIIDTNWILFPLGFIADAVIYIFSFKVLRSTRIRRWRVR